MEFEFLVLGDNVPGETLTHAGHMTDKQTFRYLVQLTIDREYGTFKKFDNPHAVTEWIQLQFDEGAIGPATVYEINNESNHSTLYGVYYPYEMKL